MSEKDVEDFASTKHKGLPKKVKSKENVKKLEENILKLIEDYLRVAMNEFNGHFY